MNDDVQRPDETTRGAGSKPTYRLPFYVPKLFDGFPEAHLGGQVVNRVRIHDCMGSTAVSKNTDS